MKSKIKLVQHIGIILQFLGIVGLWVITAFAILKGYKTNSPILVMTSGLLFIGASILFNSILKWTRK